MLYITYNLNWSERDTKNLACNTLWDDCGIIFSGQKRLCDHIGLGCNIFLCQVTFWNEIIDAGGIYKIYKETQT